MLLDVSVPLPTVDWAPVLESLIKRFSSLRLHVFFFASKHSLLSRSKSLTKVFTTLLMGPTGENETWKEIAVSPDGLGRLLELGGFIASDETSFSLAISKPMFGSCEEVGP